MELCRLRHRIGHRGSALMFFAALDLIYGTILIRDEPIPGTGLSYVADNWPSLQVWGWIWVAVGLVCFTYAFVRQDTPAFVIAMALKFLWAAAHFWAYLDGAPRGLAAMVIWLWMTALVVIIATWPEPPEGVP